MPASVYHVEVHRAEVDVLSGSSDAWEEVIPRGEVSYPSEPQFRFIIEAKVNYMPASKITTELEGGDMGEFVTIINRLSVPIRLLRRDEATWRRTIYRVLMSMDEPCEGEAGDVENIYELAYHMMLGGDKSSVVVDPPPCMKVDVKAMIIVDDEDVVDEELIDVSALSDKVCPICLEGFEGCRGGYELWRLRCSHVFHSDCIMQWKMKSDLCPYCRQNCCLKYSE